MIEFLYRRKVIREMLNQFSTKQWNIVIPIILEIGVHYLRNNFRTTELNIQDFKNILEDMKNKDSELSSYLKLRSKEDDNKGPSENIHVKDWEERPQERIHERPQERLQERQHERHQEERMINQNTNMNNVRNYYEEENQKTYFDNMKKTNTKNTAKITRNKTTRNFVARKPSGEWRKGDEYVFGENENLKNLKKIYSSSPGKYKLTKVFIHKFRQE
jgi:hypothetical protein